MRLSILTALFLTLLFSSSLHVGAQTQNDTLYAYLSETSVVIDGKADDACWANADWHAIDQVWILYNETMKDGDFQGRFKLAWDSLYLYLLAEIIDDSLSDDHVNPFTNYWDDDCVEIFLDENRSKGNHLTNYNAFAYHVSLTYDVIDGGTGTTVNLKDNLSVVMDTIGDHTYRWEFAIKNYDEKFNPNNPEASRVNLHHNKLMGFTLAYCDNDETTGRENFIGSMYMTSATANDNYKTADYFGSLLLVDPDFQEGTAVKKFDQNEALKLFPNPVTDYLTINYPDSGNEKVQVEIWDLNGKLVLQRNLISGTKLFVGELKDGMYQFNFISNNQFYTKTFLKVH